MHMDELAPEGRKANLVGFYVGGLCSLKRRQWSLEICPMCSVLRRVRLRGIKYTLTSSSLKLQEGIWSFFFSTKVGAILIWLGPADYPFSTWRPCYSNPISKVAILLTVAPAVKNDGRKPVFFAHFFEPRFQDSPLIPHTKYCHFFFLSLLPFAC